MLTFALVTEGITDQVVLSALLTGYYAEEPEIRIAQPTRDATDRHRQGTFAGWENVLAYCSLDAFEQLFSVNDYVVIQIDTDVCNQKNFDIPLTANGETRPVADIVTDVKSHLISRMQPTVHARFGKRMIFAISVHALECWLLPLFGKTRTEMQRTNNCESHLNLLLNKLDLHYEKSYRVYQRLTKDFLKPKHILASRGCNQSLDLFVGALPSF